MRGSFLTQLPRKSEEVADKGSNADVAATKAPAAALGGAVLLLALHSLAYVLWTEDDAAVSLRYAVHLADGVGLVYNPGERVEAISNLGYVLLLAPIYRLLSTEGALVQLLVAAKLIGLVAAALGLVEARRLARAVGLGPTAASIALLLLGASTPYAAWSVGGLETPLVIWCSAALVAAGAELTAGEHSWAPLVRAAVAAAALTLIRVDGFVLPVIVAVAVALLRTRTASRAALAVIASSGAVLVAVLLFRLSYYGHWFPSPVGAKLDLEASLARAGETVLVYVRPFLRLHGGWPLAIAALTLPWLSRTAPARRFTTLTVAGIMAYNLAIGKDWMPLYRFLTPAIIPLVVLVLILGQGLLQRIPWRPSRAILAALVGAAVAASMSAGHQSFRTRRDSPMWYLHPTVAADDLIAFWSPAVDWLASHVGDSRDGTLLTSEAGFIPYLSGFRTVDSYGLATPAIATLPLGTVARSTLGVETRFVAGKPSDPAQAYIAGIDAVAVVLQEHMVRLWNDGETPEELFGGRYRLAAESPVGRWAIYLPVEAASAAVRPRGSAPE